MVHIKRIDEMSFNNGIIPFSLVINIENII